jgi:NAD(P)-dependent dehydrogenase (short-subunit alcohol dehydrogenase family)
LREKALDAFGRFDILVNNAGVGPKPGPVQNITDEEYDRVMNANARGLFLTTRAFVQGIDQKSDHRRRLQCRRRVGNALSGWHRKWYAGAPAHEALLPAIWSCRPSGWSVQSGSAGSSCGFHRERPQAGEPGLIARQAPGSLSHPGAVAVPVDSTFENVPRGLWEKP